MVMAFEEQSQAATLEDKICSGQRSCNLLRSKIDFRPEDIIFRRQPTDQGYGLTEHNSHGIDFVNAVAEIKSYSIPEWQVMG